MKTINIIELRNAENDNAALSDICSNLSDLMFAESTLTNEENDKLQKALTILQKIHDSLFARTKKITHQYLKTA